MRRLAPVPHYKPVQLKGNNSLGNSRKDRTSRQKGQEHSRNEGPAMRAGTPIRMEKECSVAPKRSSCDVESLPNSSAVFSISALADRDDVIAAVRTATLLADSSGCSLAVTVLDESVLFTAHGDTVSPAKREDLLAAIKTQLLTPHHASRATQFALEASITAASFLKSTSISLHVRSVDSLPQNPSITR